MMHYWNDGFDAWWWMLPMMVFMFAVVGVAVWALVRATRPDSSAAPRMASPEEVLARRLATGEIDAAEYQERVDTLRGRVPQSG